MLSEKQIQFMINYYEDYHINADSIATDSYFLDNYMTLVECKNFDIHPYDAERIIELRKIFNVGLTISQTMGIISTLSDEYNIDSFDLETILKQ